MRGCGAHSRRSTGTRRVRSMAVRRLGRLYERHHRLSRDGGDFVFVPERIPLFRAAIDGPGKAVLDLGCRSGGVARTFLEGNHVVGVDVDPAALARAATLGIETVVADVEEPLPFADASFDAVVVGELLEHLRDPAAAIGEARRVLRPGGVLVGSVPNAFRLKSRLLFLAGRAPEDDPTHLQLFSPSRVEILLAGLDDVRIAFVGGRFTRFHPRLFGRDLVFRATRPPRPASEQPVSERRAA